MRFLPSKISYHSPLAFWPLKGLHVSICWAYHRTASCSFSCLLGWSIWSSFGWLPMLPIDNEGGEGEEGGERKGGGEGGGEEEEEGPRGDGLKWRILMTRRGAEHGVPPTRGCGCW